MPAIYEYACPICRAEIESFTRTGVSCPACKVPAKRRFRFNTQPVMQAHWNVSVGAEVSDFKQYKRLLARKSEEDGERLNLPVNYQPVDLSDKEALGVTDEGMDTTYARRRATGQDEAKRYFFV